MNFFTTSPSSLTNATSADFPVTALQSLESHPEASSYLHLSCDEAICERINRALEELDLPEFFTS